MNKKVFGYQLVVDLYSCRDAVCDDLNLCYDFLDKVVEFLKMEKQAPPNIFISDSKKYPDKAGLSGWVPLIESSVVIHTLSKKNFITVDVYSCKEFDPKSTEEYVRNFFGAKLAKSQFFYRGLDYYNIDLNE